MVGIVFVGERVFMLGKRLGWENQVLGFKVSRFLGFRQIEFQCFVQLLNGRKKIRF